MTKRGYGIPLICPKCPTEWAYRFLKIPGVKVPTCPTCRTLLEPVDPERRKTWKRGGDPTSP